MTNLFSRLASYFAWAGVLLASGAAANNHLFVPGQPCTGCTVEISDHAGVIPTSKNAVYRVQSTDDAGQPINARRRSSIDAKQTRQSRNETWSD